MASKAFKPDSNELFRNSDRTNEIVVNLSKNLTYMLNIKDIKKFVFLTSNAKKAFNCLKQVFIKALIFKYFN